MHIITVKAHNIGPYEDLNVRLDNRGVVLLTGKNGVGKSTLVDIVQLGLYGRSARYDSYKDMLRKGETEGFISISIQIGEDIYAINRAIMTDRQRLKLHKGENDITGIHMEATQEKLDRILNTSWNVFSNIVTISGEPVLFSETDGYQKSFMERMLGFEVYTAAKDKAMEFKRSLAEYISELKLKLSIATQQQQTLKTQIETLSDKDVQVKKAKLADAQIQLDGIKADMFGVDGEVKNLDSVLTFCKDHLEQMLERSKEYRDKLENLTNIRQAESHFIIQLGMELKHQEAIAGSEPCPTCQRQPEQTEIQAAMKQADRIHVELDNKNRIMDDCIEEYNKLMKIHEEDEAARQAIGRKIEGIESTKTSLRAQKNSLLRKEENIRKRFEEIKAEAGAELAPLHRALSEKEVEISDISKELKEQYRTADIIEFCIEAFGDKGIKSLLIEQYLMDISEAMNENLEFLTDGKMSAFLTPTKKMKSVGVRDKMTLQVMDRDTGEELLDYKHCSEGQRACVNIAALLAFHGIISLEKGVSWGILFLDEVLESLDTDRMKNMVRLLAKKVEVFPSIILTTHRPELNEAFEQVWIVSKKGGVSVLEDVRD